VIFSFLYSEIIIAFSQLSGGSSSSHILIEPSLGVLLFHSLARTVVSSFKVMALLFSCKYGYMLFHLHEIKDSENC
jgi:hypothetical protein